MQNRFKDPHSDSQEEIIATIKHDLFNNKAFESETIVLYYSGHGLEYSGALNLYGKENYQSKMPLMFNDIADMW